MRPVAIRFTPEMISTVRRFAREDHLTVSEWLRRAVTRELKRPRPVDVSRYPRSQTVASGVTTVKWSGNVCQYTWTGQWPSGTS